MNIAVDKLSSMLDCSISTHLNSRVLFQYLATVVKTLDSAIHRMDHIQWMSITKKNNNNYIIHWVDIYPVDSAIHLLNN